MENSENKIPENQEQEETAMETTNPFQSNDGSNMVENQPTQETEKKQPAKEVEESQPPQVATENRPVQEPVCDRPHQPDNGWGTPRFNQPPWTPYPQYPLQQPQYQPPQGKRRESPFANSPYVMNPAWQPQSAPVVPPQNQPKPLKPKAEKKTAPQKTWHLIVAAVVVLALIVGSCFATAAVVDYNWQKQATGIVEEFSSQISDLEKQIEDISNSNSVVVPGDKGNSGNNNNYNNGDVGAVTNGLLTPAQVYAQNVESVVLIYNAIRTGNGQNGYSTGSGFILTADGYVVTNHHVIEGNGTLTVIMSDGTEYPAKLIGSDNTNDVALLKIDGKNLPAVTIGSSDALVVGDQVAAIGNPLGELTSTLTVGYVSAKERDVNTEGFAINMLQTDAAINSGNSGGPLFNMKGEVVGITTAKYSGTSSSGASIEGVGFAIPIDDVIGLINDLTTYGYINSAYMGVSVSDMDPEAAEYYGMPLGAYVQSVEQDGPAQKAGIRAKDIIVKLGDYDIENVNDLGKALRNLKAGDVVTVVVYRSGSGAEVKLTITLEQKPVTN